VQWKGLDLRHALIPHARLVDALVIDCLFDKAKMEDLRAWTTTVRDCSFVGASLKGAALATPQDGGNTWENVVFDGADLRQMVAKGGRILGCSFKKTKLLRANFEQVALQRCVFAGPMVEVTFDGRELPGEPAPSPMVEVDFSEATFHELNFWGCRFEECAFPAKDITLIPDYPSYARRMFGALERDGSVPALMVEGVLENELNMAGVPADATAVYNRQDWMSIGGSGMATLFDRLVEDVVGDAAQRGA
jgi:uncharacterized protein YjbI with pentapeptide repeats